MNIDKIREDFPILKREINGFPLVYLDSAATSQKPVQVIDAISEYYRNHNANIMRAVHTLSEEATNMYENSRKKVKNFIGAEKEEEIIFLKNTTEGLNLVMYSWGMDNISKRDKIALTIAEHHANLVPWQQLAKMKGAELEYIGITNEGELEKGWEQKIKGAKLLAVNHVSNVLGIVNDIVEICKVCKEENAISVIDGSQSVPHMKIDVKKLNCDFIAFTGHKMLGPTGIGVLYGKKELLEKMNPFLYGGEMNKKVDKKNCEWSELPHKFEAGTPNISGAVGLGAATDYLTKIGMENIEKQDKELVKHAMELFSESENIEVIGPKEYSNKKTGIVSFNIKGLHAHDVASILNEYGIAVRSGFHCAQPLHNELNIDSSVRASFYLYNTKKEINYLTEKLKEIKI